MSEDKQERPFPVSLSFLLNNPIRRRQQPPSELIAILLITPTDVVMDFGCGPGFFTFEIANKSAKQAIAVDLSNEMLRKVEDQARKANVKNIQFIQSNGKNIQLENQIIDLVLLVTVYHEVHDHKAVLKEFNRILKSEGKLAIVEVVKKARFLMAPVQDPDVLKEEIEGSGFFKLEKTVPYKRYAFLEFAKKS
jgi:ubiquinone/menaquinone biosynthesis C-methylase UbiE